MKFLLWSVIFFGIAVPASSCFAIQKTGTLEQNLYFGNITTIQIDAKNIIPILQKTSDLKTIARMLDVLIKMAILYTEKINFSDFYADIWAYPHKALLNNIKAISHTVDPWLEQSFYKDQFLWSSAIKAAYLQRLLSIHIQLQNFLNSWPNNKALMQQYLFAITISLGSFLQEIGYVKKTRFENAPSSDLFVTNIKEILISFAEFLEKNLYLITDESSTINSEEKEKFKKLMEEEKKLDSLTQTSNIIDPEINDEDNLIKPTKNRDLKNYLLDMAYWVAITTKSESGTPIDENFYKNSLKQDINNFRNSAREYFELYKE